MKHKSKSFFTQYFSLILALILVATLAFGSPTTIPNNNNVGNENTASLEITDLEDTQIEELSWTQVANKAIPSVVLVTSNDPITGEGGSGSGIIISEDGYIITNAHVIGNEQNSLAVRMPEIDDNIYEANLIGMDTYTDLALIKINASNLVPAEFANSSELVIAQDVMAVGFPGGLDVSPSAAVTGGMVSALERPIDMGAGYVIESIQVDAAISPGNSGGALVNSYGQVIGVPTSKVAAYAYEGLGFAIPSNIVQTIVNDLLEFGYVTDRASLGVGVVLYNEQTAVTEGYPSSGLLVEDIFAQATSDSGLQVGDFITQVENEPVNNLNIINYYLQQKQPSDTLQIEVYRGGSFVNLNILLSNYNQVYNS